MKKKTLKKLRMIAQTLPKTIEEYNLRSKILGKDLIKEGIRMVEGEDVEHEKIYYRTDLKIREFNHYRKLKKFHKKYGLQFMAEYMKWFKPYHERMVKKYPQLFKDISNEENIPA